MSVWHVEGRVPIANSVGAWKSLVLQTRILCKFWICMDATGTRRPLIKYRPCTCMTIYSARWVPANTSIVLTWISIIQGESPSKYKCCTCMDIDNIKQIPSNTSLVPTWIGVHFTWQALIQYKPCTNMDVNSAWRAPSNTSPVPTWMSIVLDKPHPIQALYQHGCQ